PKTRTPAASRRSESPATSGASGPTTTRSTARSRASRTSPSTSSAATGTFSARAAVPALPGAPRRVGRRGLRASAWRIACSRPPPPTTRTVGEVAADNGRRAMDGGTARRSKIAGGSASFHPRIFVRAGARSVVRRPSSLPYLPALTSPAAALHLLLALLGALTLLGAPTASAALPPPIPGHPVAPADTTRPGAARAAVEILPRFEPAA